MNRPRTTGLVAAVILLTAGCGSGAQAPSAAEQVPRLGAVLKQVDEALAAHRYAAARQDLRSLKTAVVKARSAGELRDADATRVLDAVSALTSQLPDASTGSTQSPATTATTTATSHPTESASSHPAQPRSSAATPGSSPTASASTSQTPSSSPTPSSVATTTTQVSPAAASVTPSP